VQSVTDDLELTMSFFLDALYEALGLPRNGGW
jgi:hypothetical protein